MKSFSALSVLIVAICAALWPTAALAAQPVQVYANLPEISLARISPDGAYVAMLQPVSGAASVTIYKVGGGSPCAFAPTDVTVHTLLWVSPKQLLVQVSYQKVVTAIGEQYRPRDFERLILIDAQCKNPRLVLGNLDQVREVIGGNVNFEGRLPNDDQHFLVSSFGFSMLGGGETCGNQVTGFELYKVDAETGRGEQIYRGGNRSTCLALRPNERLDVGTRDVVLDLNGVPRVRYDRLNKEGDVAILIRSADKDDWHEVYRFGGAHADAKAWVFQGFSDNPNIAYVATRAQGDKYAAYEFDMQSGKLGRLVYQDPKVDIEGLRLDPFTRRVIGVMYDTLEGEKTYWLDKSWAQADANLHATFENSHIAISSTTRDRTKYTVYVQGPEDPGGAYFLYDAAKPEITKIGSLYPAITSADYAPQKVISYRARDGMEIPAYLTIPPGMSGKNMPLVVMPHGGPEARDSIGHFDWWAQFVASRGFIVLQPQFRGSEGFGESFKLAGRHKWGLEMQNDVSDGVKYLIDQGIADPKKVCIVGWSYGGYAAMAGVTLTPELYKCGIAVAGVSNLITMLGYVSIHYGAGFSEETNYWPRVIGEPTRDGERLRATSPAMHADAVTASLLLIHGANDTTVPIEQSEQMAQAMDRAGKPYQFVRVESDDHQMRRAASRKQMLEAMDKFLQQQLK